MAHPEEAPHEQVPDGHPGLRQRPRWLQPGRRLARRRSVRTRITTLLVVPLMLFTLVWAWGLYLTAESTLEINLLARTEATLHQQTAEVLNAVHEERRATSAYLGGDQNPRYRSDLLAARKTTDRAAAGLDSLLTDDVLEAVNPQERDWLRTTQKGIGGLNRLRERVDNGEAGRPTAEEQYTDLARACLGVFEQMTADINPAYGSYHQTMVDLQKAREALSLEDSLIAGALARGRLTTTEYATFVRRVGATRALFAEAEANIVDEQIRSHTARTLSSDAFAQLRELEDTLAAEERTDHTLPFTATQWNSTAGQVIGDLLHLDHMVHTALVDHATPVVISIVTNIAGMIVLGLIVIGIAVYLRRRTLRPLTRDLV
ncbi:MAG: nitrate- and nitrite sensing domain-containing protein, partial [Micromonosporaceae bacterium]